MFILSVKLLLAENIGQIDIQTLFDKDNWLTFIFLKHFAA